jgi:hypothetical protein
VLRAPPTAVGTTPVQLTADPGAIAGISTGAIYLIAAVPLVIAALIASIIWRSAKRERASRALRSRLESPNPQTRRDALDKVTDEVLSIHSAMLCELLAREYDPEVLEALAAAVARSKWEPTDDAALLELRRWVAGAQTSDSSSGSVFVPAAPAALASETGAQPAMPAPAPTNAVPVEAAPPLAAMAPAAEPSAPVHGTEGRAGEPPPGTPARDGDLTDLVHKVQAVLGEGVERVELVSIDGELLTSWSSGQRTTGTAPPSDDA